MEFSQFIQAVCALAFVLGLLFITLWLIKLCQQKGLSCSLSKKLLGNPKIKLLEQKRLDAKNTLSLISYEKEEILLLINHGAGLVISKKTMTDKTKEKKND